MDVGDDSTGGSTDGGNVTTNKNHLSVSYAQTPVIVSSILLFHLVTLGSEICVI